VGREKEGKGERTDGRGKAGREVDLNKAILKKIEKRFSVREILYCLIGKTRINQGTIQFNF